MKNQTTTADACIHKQGGVCTILVGKKRCSWPTQKCAFHQSKLEAEESKARYDQIMNAKTPEEQRYYANKYYGGKMPWKGVKEK